MKLSYSTRLSASCVRFTGYVVRTACLCLRTRSVRHPLTTGCAQALLLLALLFAGCSESKPSTPDNSAPVIEDAAPTAEEAGPAAGETAATSTEAAPAEAPATPATLSATIRVIDLQGETLPGMMPIVTRQPNAFDEPVATGTSTGLDGMGSIRFKTDEHLFLRAWDASLRYFPNNFYEVLPGGAKLDDDLTIQMVPSANLDVQLFLPTGEPASEQAVALMLFHPTRGPWWPAEAKTDKEGVATFPNLPAGEYVLRFKVESGPRLEQGQTALPPASTVNLGAVTLQES